GNWSMIGQDIRLNAGSKMNIDSARIKAGQFNQFVLHEFEHARGLYHEHQNPHSSCDDEIDWDKAVAYLQQRYGLSAELVTENFRPLMGQFLAGPFDERSIMMYELPKEIFRESLLEAGSAPACLQPGNKKL